MTDLLLAEELLLIALDDDSGANHAQVTLDAGLAGAVLLDLVAARAVRVEGDKIDAEPGQRPSHPLLSDALDAIAADSKPRTVEHWVNALPRRLKPFKRRVADGLVDRGVLSPERRKALGVFPTTRYVAADAAPERDVRARLTSALLDGGDAGERTALLVALLAPTDLIRRVVPRERRREAKARATEIADRGPVGEAVDEAIQSVQAAAVASVVAAASASAAAGAGS